MSTSKPEDTLLARRGLLQGLTAVAATSTLTACGDMVRPTQPFNNPIDQARETGALNTLLALEYTVIDAYTQAAVILTAARDDASSTQARRDLAALVLSVALEFQKDHAEHAALLSETVTGMSTTPIRADEARFTPPAGFRPSVGNVMKLAANEERRAAIGYNRVIKGLQWNEARFIIASIEGTETQHYMVLKALIETLVDVTPAVDVSQVVPQPFVSSTASLGGGSGLQDQPNLAVTDNG